MNNTASNAGGVGMLWAGAFIFNSLFEGNRAVGTGANDNDATMCTCSNMGNNNQIGSGGNGGAIYKDGGDGATSRSAATDIEGNSANEFGAGGLPHGRRLGGAAHHRRLDAHQEHADNSVWQWCHGVSTDNPHANGDSTSSPSPLHSTFCDPMAATAR